eukprot:6461802-Amphidinium_carterae.1
MHKVVNSSVVCLIFFLFGVRSEHLVWSTVRASWKHRSIRTEEPMTCRSPKAEAMCVVKCSTVWVSTAVRVLIDSTHDAPH